MVKLPSDKLKERRHPWRIAAIIAVGLLVVAGGTVIAAAALKPDTGRPVAVIVHLVGEAGKPTLPQVTHKLMDTQHVLKSTTPPPPPPAPENYYGNPGPVQCPGGTIAGQVDDYGNESNCQPTNNGQPCVEYNELNQCVAWYKP